MRFPVTPLKIFNPATGEVICELPTDSKDSLARKFDEAKGAQKVWRTTSLSERIDCANRFKNLLLAHIESLAKDLTLETGKPISQSRSEIRSVTSRIDFFAENTPMVLAPQSVSKKGAPVEEIIESEPLGVIANISAWNYPYFVGLNVLVPALLAGNAVVYKPSEYASLSGLHIVRLLKEAGFPSGLIASAIGNAQVGDALLDLPVNGVFFTGSQPTGQKILQKVGSRMIRLQLELGGKDGIYVCDDADLAHAVPSISEGAFYNAGQGCCSVERIFVHQDIYERFKSAFIKEVSALPIGPPLDDSTFIGPLTRPQHIDFLLEQVQEAQKSNEKILLGGHRLPGLGSYFSPTIIECSQTTTRLMQEESFGPIVAIQSVQSDDDAIARLNDTDFGLTAGVYSKDKDRAIQILKQVVVGSAYWNCCDRVSPSLPWSGRKGSGMGSTLGAEGIRCFVQSKSWHLRSQTSL